MNYQILAGTELNRKVSLFQKAVEQFAKFPSMDNAKAVYIARCELCAFALEGL